MYFYCCCCCCYIVCLKITLHAMLIVILMLFRCLLLFSCFIVEVLTKHVPFVSYTVFFTLSSKVIAIFAKSIASIFIDLNTMISFELGSFELFAFHTLICFVVFCFDSFAKFVVWQIDLCDVNVCVCAFVFVCICRCVLVFVYHLIFCSVKSQFKCM